MNFRIIRTLLKKEITDIFRDTKTIIIMIVVPLVLYPLLFLGTMLLTSNIIKESTVKTYNVAIVSSTEEDYAFVESLLKEALDTHQYHFDISKFPADEDYEKSLRNEKYQGIISIKTLEDDYPDFEVYTLTSSNKSSTCKGMIDQVLKDYKEKIIDEKLKDAIADYDALTADPFEIDHKDYSSKEETKGMAGKAISKIQCERGRRPCERRSGARSG